MATNINSTVQTVLQIVSDIRGETETNTDARRIRAVSRANQDFALRKLWKFYLMPDQTTVGSGVNSYSVGSATYPMRPKGLSEVFVWPTATGSQDETYRYDIIDFNAFKYSYSENNTVQVVYEWYDKANDVWKMYINPAPEATDTIKYSYYWQPPTLTATTDYCVCPNPRVIALLASAEIHDAEDERDTAMEEKNEAEQLTSEIIGLDNMPAQNQIYTVGAIEGLGIGTY
jgi:hypothetical protein